MQLPVEFIFLGDITLFEPTDEMIEVYLHILADKVNVIEKGHNNECNNRTLSDIKYS